MMMLDGVPTVAVSNSGGGPNDFPPPTHGGDSSQRMRRDSSGNLAKRLRELKQRVQDDPNVIALDAFVRHLSDLPSTAFVDFVGDEHHVFSQTAALFCVTWAHTKPMLHDSSSRTTLLRMSTAFALRAKDNVAVRLPRAGRSFRQFIEEKSVVIFAVTVILQIMSLTLQATAIQWSELATTSSGGNAAGAGPSGPTTTLPATTAVSSGGEFVTTRFFLSSATATTLLFVAFASHATALLLVIALVLPSLRRCRNGLLAVARQTLALGNAGQLATGSGFEDVIKRRLQELLGGGGGLGGLAGGGATGLLFSVFGGGGGGTQVGGLIGSSASGATSSAPMTFNQRPPLSTPPGAAPSNPRSVYNSTTAATAISNGVGGAGGVQLLPSPHNAFANSLTATPMAGGNASGGSSITFMSGGAIHHISASMPPGSIHAANASVSYPSWSVGIFSPTAPPMTHAALFTKLSETFPVGIALFPVVASSTIVRPTLTTAGAIVAAASGRGSWIGQQHHPPASSPASIGPIDADVRSGSSSHHQALASGSGGSGGRSDSPGMSYGSPRAEFRSTRLIGVPTLALEKNIVMFGLDERNRITYWNLLASFLSGYPSMDVLGQPADQYVCVMPVSAASSMDDSAMGALFTPLLGAHTSNTLVSSAGLNSSNGAVDHAVGAAATSLDPSQPAAGAAGVPSPTTHGASSFLHPPTAPSSAQMFHHSNGSPLTTMTSSTPHHAAGGTGSYNDVVHVFCSLSRRGSGSGVAGVAMLELQGWSVKAYDVIGELQRVFFLFPRAQPPAPPQQQAGGVPTARAAVPSGVSSSLGSSSLGSKSAGKGGKDKGAPTSSSIPSGGHHAIDTMSTFSSAAANAMMRNPGGYLEAFVRRSLLDTLNAFVPSIWKARRDFRAAIRQSSKAAAAAGLAQHQAAQTVSSTSPDVVGGMMTTTLVLTEESVSSNRAIQLGTSPNVGTTMTMGRRGGGVTSVDDGQQLTPIIGSPTPPPQKADVDTRSASEDGASTNRTPSLAPAHDSAMMDERDAAVTAAVLPSLLNSMPDVVDDEDDDDDDDEDENDDVDEVAREPVREDADGGPEETVPSSARPLNNLPTPDEPPEAEGQGQAPATSRPRQRRVVKVKRRAVTDLRNVAPLSGSGESFEDGPNAAAIVAPPLGPSTSPSAAAAAAAGGPDMSPVPMSPLSSFTAGAGAYGTGVADGTSRADDPSPLPLVSGDEGGSRPRSPSDTRPADAGGASTGGDEPSPLLAIPTPASASAASRPRRSSPSGNDPRGKTATGVKKTPPATSLDAARAMPPAASGGAGVVAAAAAKHPTPSLSSSVPQLLAHLMQYEQWMLALRTLARCGRPTHLDMIAEQVQVAWEYTSAHRFVAAALRSVASRTTGVIDPAFPATVRLPAAAAKAITRIVEAVPNARVDVHVRALYGAPLSWTSATTKQAGGKASPSGPSHPIGPEGDHDVCYPHILVTMLFQEVLSSQLFACLRHRYTELIEPELLACMGYFITCGEGTGCVKLIIPCFVDPVHLLSGGDHRHHHARGGVDLMAPSSQSSQGRFAAGTGNLTTSSLRTSHSLSVNASFHQSSHGGLANNFAAARDRTHQANHIAAFYHTFTPLLAEQPRADVHIGLVIPDTMDRSSFAQYLLHRHRTSVSCYRSVDEVVRRCSVLISDADAEDADENLLERISTNRYHGPSSRGGGGGGMSPTRAGGPMGSPIGDALAYPLVSTAAVAGFGPQRVSVAPIDVLIIDAAAAQHVEAYAGEYLPQLLVVVVHDAANFLSLGIRGDQSGGRATQQQLLKQLEATGSALSLLDSTPTNNHSPHTSSTLRIQPAEPPAPVLQIVTSGGGPQRPSSVVTSVAQFSAAVLTGSNEFAAAARWQLQQHMDTLARHQGWFHVLRDPVDFDVVTLVMDLVTHRISARKQKEVSRREQEALFSIRHDSPWEKGRKLGQGSFGAVFEAVSTITGGRMAVKEVTYDDPNDGKTRALLKSMYNELGMLLRLQHAHILFSFHASAGHGVLWLFMELCDCSLHDVIKSHRKWGAIGQRRLSAVAPLIIRQILQALGYLHQQHITHCDVKPQNILIKQGSAKLSDFGTAQRMLRLAKSNVNIAPQVDRSGGGSSDGGQLTSPKSTGEGGDGGAPRGLKGVQGTLKYMAPEVYRGETYGTGCDVWSLGCVLCNLLDLEMPSIADIAAAMIQAEERQPPPSTSRTPNATAGGRRRGSTGGQAKASAASSSSASSPQGNNNTSGSNNQNANTTAAGGDAGGTTATAPKERNASPAKQMAQWTPVVVGTSAEGGGGVTTTAPPPPFSQPTAEEGSSSSNAATLQGVDAVIFGAVPSSPPSKLELSKGEWDAARAFLQACLAPNPSNRLAAQMLLLHPYLTQLDVQQQTALLRDMVVETVADLRGLPLPPKTLIPSQLGAGGPGGGMQRSPAAVGGAEATKGEGGGTAATQQATGGNVEAKPVGVSDPDGVFSLCSNAD